MQGLIFFMLSAAALIGSVVFAIIRGKSKHKRGRVLTPVRILFAGIVVSSVVLFIPLYLNTFKESDCGIFETFLLSVHNMIKLFLVDGEFQFITTNIGELSGWLLKAYTVMFSVLFVVAPMLTYVFVLSFFKNVSAYKRYITHYKRDVYIFSKLNEKSLTLAEDLYKNNSKGRFFVFTDVFEKSETQTFELVERAKELGAVCFKKDIITVNLSFHSKKSDMTFFAIGDDQSENISQSLKLIEKFKYRDKTNLYVFSTQTQAEMLLANAFDSADNQSGQAPKIKVRRVNEVASLITRTLYEQGYEKIFCSAAENGSVKLINAVVIGMGQHGTEMTKALSWFCQMDGYILNVNSFDIDPNAADKFVSLCPELMDAKFNGNFNVKGEAKYNIKIHSGIDVNTKTFDDIITALPQTTYVFVALGNDEVNISTAVRLRMLCARQGINPQIQAVVYNTDKKQALCGVTNYKHQKYDIDFIGDMASSYSEAVILNSDIEAKAKERHLKWGKESEFWQFDYNYKSSLASAIHREMKIKCNIPGITKDPSIRTEEELWGIRILEHCRWNAYMRSEGYVFGGTVEKSGRNDLAKTHNCLVAFDMLPPDEQAKDDD